MESNNEIISRLKFISRIQKGEKVNTKYLYVQPVGFLTGLARTLFNQDNRGNTMNFIQSTIIRAFDILSSHKQSEKQSERITCINILQDLKKCKGGLVNLKDTYVIDVKFCCDLDVMIQEIDAKISDLEGVFQVEEDNPKKSNLVIESLDVIRK